jgi:hypothetical protein
MIRIEIHTENDAFAAPFGHSEAARILRTLADRLEAHEIDGESRIADCNGNCVGRASIEIYRGEG